MSKVSYHVGETIKFPLWLIFHRNGNVRLTRREPSLEREERALAIDASLPLALWSTPSLHATLNVASPDAPASVNIDLHAAAEALKSALGVDIDLHIHAPEGDPA